LQTTLLYLHLTDDGEDNGRAKLDEIAQPGDLFKDKFKFPETPPAKPKADEPKPDQGNSGKRNSNKRKPK
jgi:hypothetical protein